MPAAVTLPAQWLSGSDILGTLQRYPHRNDALLHTYSSFFSSSFTKKQIFHFQNQIQKFAATPASHETIHGIPKNALFVLTKIAKYRTIQFCLPPDFFFLQFVLFHVFLLDDLGCFVVKPFQTLPANNRFLAIFPRDNILCPSAPFQITKQFLVLAGLSLRCPIS
jgi:hypothetical protein